MSWLIGDSLERHEWAIELSLSGTRALLHGGHLIDGAVLDPLELLER